MSERIARAILNIPSNLPIPPAITFLILGLVLLHSIAESFDKLNTFFVHYHIVLAHSSHIPAL